MKANATIASLFVAASVVVCGADELVLAEREKTFQEEIAEIAAATVPTTACDRAEVPASRLRLSVPGVRGEQRRRVRVVRRLRVEAPRRAVLLAGSGPFQEGRRGLGDQCRVG